MSDDDLRRECIPLRVESVWDRSGCSAAVSTVIVLAFLVAAGARNLTGASWPSISLGAIPAAFFGALGMYLGVSHLINRRRQPYRDELAYRYGSAPGKVYVKEALSLLVAGDPPDAVLLLSIWALPYGGHRWIRIVLRKAGSPNGVVEVKEVGFCREGIERARLSQAEGQLPGAPAARILELLQVPGTEALTNLMPDVKDGLRCELTVIEGKRSSPRVASCNLAGLSEEDTKHPTVVFCRAVLEASRHLAGHDMVWGACSAVGEVKIGGV
jgi:hypothetical protein